MGKYIKSINFRIRLFFLESKIIKFVTAVFYLLSEFEMLTQLQSDFIFFRKIYFYLIRIKIGQKSYIGRNAILYNSFNIVIGDFASIGENCMLHAHAKITIGNDFLAAPGLTINSGGHNVFTLQPTSKEIVIGDRVWCGVNVTILPGVIIGNDVVIGAGSVVNKNVNNNTVIAGNPAKEIRTINRNGKIWTLYER